ncbi:hypothetical protein ABZV78_26660 [Micromonospora sp. NPDC004540]|uniref:hypothetical protein n=1 Tax=Micromonospora sp. NPDC004540 TaxID=3154457 RepID=UPI0033ADB18B
MTGRVARSALPTAPGGGWDGLALEVDTPVRPGLRVEVAGARRFLIRQADRVVLLARQHPRHHGVHYVRTGAYRSPVPPISAAEARRVGDASGEGDRAARWAHRFAGWLAEAEDGPLHRGPWTLTPGMPHWAVPSHWPRLPVVDPDRGHITWFGYGHPVEDQRDILPLRRLAAPDSARVRSWRRRVRDGTLPPVLLWWVSGLQTLLVLDGHDRIVAALAEGSRPAVLVLAPPVDPALAAAGERRELRVFSERMAALAGRTDVAPARLVAASQQFGAALRDVARDLGRNRAWPLPGGAGAWERLAADVAPGWPPAEER